MSKEFRLNVYSSNVSSSNGKSSNVSSSIFNLSNGKSFYGYSSHELGRRTPILSNEPEDGQAGDGDDVDFGVFLRL
jgi:hypothetical protein